MKTVTHYKRNDKIICKKTLIFNEILFYTKNKTYNIEAVNEESISIYNEFNNSSVFRLYIPNEDQFKLKDYFISIQEQRKQKLKNLKNVHTTS